MKKIQFFLGVIGAAILAIGIISAYFLFAAVMIGVCIGIISLTVIFIKKKRRLN